MARITESLNGGLVTSRDPALLQPGQLSDLKNLVYRRGSPALHRATGREVFGTVSATATDVVGLRDVLFDNGNHYLFAHASNLYFRSAVGDAGAGSFTSVTAAAGSGGSLESAHFDNSFFFFNGGYATASADRNTVVFLSALSTATTPSTRPHGMRDVRTTLAPVTASGSWTAPTTGIYEYWYTEVAEYFKDGVRFEVESTYTPPSKDPPGTVHVTSDDQSVVIAIPDQPVNPEATIWYLYRSVRKVELTDVAFPDGTLIATGTFGASAVFTDGVAVTGSYVSVNATAAGPGAVWASADNVLTSNNTDTTHTGTTPGFLALIFPTFSITEPVVGIQVEVKATPGLLNYLGGLRIALSNDSGASWSDNKVAQGQGVVTGADRYYTYGDTTSQWGLQWSSGKLLNSVFRVLMIGAINGSVGVDNVRARVIYGGTPATTDAVFPAVVIEESGVTSSVGRHGKPPVATTSDLFEDQLVTNDIEHPSFVRYSTPGNPDSFPELYFVDFETQDNDLVTNIKALNNRLGVFLKHAVYRMNYLPNELDANFDRGRCQELISSDLGCVNAMCAVRYTGHDGRAQIAFVSDTGIYSTDLFSAFELTDGLAWRDLVATTNSDSIALINDPEKQELIFYFRNDALGNETYQALHLNYSQEHMVLGKPKVSGPVHVRNYDSGGGGTYASLESAWPVRRATGGTSVYLGYGGASTTAGAGKVYIETGTTIPSNDPAAQYTTRRMYLAGHGNEWKLTKLYGYTGSLTGTQGFLYTAKITKTNDDTGEANGETNSLSLAGRKLHSLNFNQVAEGMRLTMQVTAGHSDMRGEFLILEGDGFGSEDSGL